VGCVLALSRRRELAELARDAAVRRALLVYAAVALWCLAWQSTVIVYSGAAWQVDWWEHYDRAQFFLAHWPRDTHFATVYPLTARPPLVNLWAAALLGGSGGAYFNYQAFATLLSTLVVFPLSALVHGNDRARGRWLVPVLLLSPLLVQNATFPWTKLPAAFFVLLAWRQLTATDELGGRVVVAAAALAGGMLAHYSTGPWIVALGLAWLANHQRKNWNECALALGIGGAILATWIAWAIAEYGLAATFTQNTTVALAPDGSLAERLTIAATNLARTVVPFSFGSVAPWLTEQASTFGRVRDSWFILYQTRLVWMCGLGGAVVLAWLLARGGHEPRATRFAAIAVPVIIVLGTAVHTQPDAFGLAHIALQPLALLGLAWIAGAMDSQSPLLRRIWCVGAAADLCCGILLHFGVQSGWLDRVWRGDAAPWAGYTRAAQTSFHDKQALHLTFLGDIAPLLLSAALFVAALLLAHRAWRWEMTSPPRSVSS
jgi:hypothetical protein